MESLSLGVSPQIVHDCQNGQLVIVVMHGILNSIQVRSFLTCSSCLFNPWCERYLKANSSFPQIVGGGVGFEFLSCFCAGFVCLLSEEAPENGAKFGAKSLDEQNWERSLWNLTPLWRRKPQLGSFPTPTPAVL